MNDDTIRSIENELTLSQDSEQTLNRRLSKLEDGNYIRNLIKHYSDIFFITLILACLIAITLFITNCIFRTRFARKESSDKHKIKSHPLEAGDSTWVEDTEGCALKWVQLHHMQVHHVQVHV